MRVETSAGVLRGSEQNGVARFLGVPFAAAPLGDARFARPRAQPSWSGTREALRAGPAAPQPKSIGVGMRGATHCAEDCLYLNVFAPTPLEAARRPVFVWIHGGGYLHGDGADPLFDGTRLAASQGLVVVTINYRLGLWGFAPLRERNVGLADQIAAIDWVARHIARFGGDPHNVTVAGESSGAMSVCNLLAAPATRGRIHRAIAQSGAADHVATLAQADETASAVRTEVGSLATADVASLLAAQAATLRRLRPSHHASPFRPHVDGDLLPVHPLAAASAAADIPLIIGTNRDEYRLYVRSSLKLTDEQLLAHVVRRLSECGIADAGRHAARVVSHYRAERPLDSRNANAAILADVETELRFREPVMRYVAARGRNSWLYRFDWPSPALRGWLGATHAIEIPFVFGNFDVPGIAKFAGGGPDAATLSHTVMSLWGHFARYGRPPPEWPVCGANDFTVLHLNRELAYVRLADDATVSLWSEVLQRQDGVEIGRSR